MFSAHVILSTYSIRGVGGLVLCCNDAQNYLHKIISMGVVANNIYYFINIGVFPTHPPLVWLLLIGEHVVSRRFEGGTGGFLEGLCGVVAKHPINALNR